jgi:hypothetical protein
MGDFNKVADVLKDPEVVVENPELGLSYPIVYYGRQTVAGIQALLAGNPGQTYEQKLSAADRFDFKKVQEARRKDKELKRYRDAARIGYIAPGSTTFITSPSSVPNSTPSTPTTPVDPNLLPLPIITDPDFEDINLDSDEEDKKPLIPVVPSPAPDVVTSRPEQEPEIVNEDNPRDDVPLLPRRRPGRGGRGGRGRRPRTRRPRGPRVPRVPAPSFDGGLAGVGGVLAGTVALVATGVTVSTIGLLTGDGPPPPTYVGPDGTPALPPVTIPPDTIPDLSPPPQQPLLPAPPQVPPANTQLAGTYRSPRKHKYGTPESIAAGGFDSQGNAIKELTMALKENTGATKDNSKTSKSGTSANMPMRKTVSAGAMGR